MVGRQMAQLSLGRAGGASSKGEFGCAAVYLGTVSIPPNEEVVFHPHTSRHLEPPFPVFCTPAGPTRLTPTTSLVVPCRFSPRLLLNTRLAPAQTVVGGDQSISLPFHLFVRRPANPGRLAALPWVHNHSSCC